MLGHQLLSSLGQFLEGCGRRRPGRLAALAACALLSAPFSAHPAILWQRPESTKVQNNSLEILKGALAPRTDSSRETLYFKLRVNPLSDIVLRSAKSQAFQAGMVFCQGGAEKLGIGDALGAYGYSAFCKAFKFPGHLPGEFTFRSGSPELGSKYPFIAPRRDALMTMVVKVEYVRGAEDLVTVWLSPNLAAGATEAGQAEKNVTQFKADASFDQITLMHRGIGDGWVFDDIAVATSFDDFVPKPLWKRPWILVTGGIAIVVALLGAVVAAERLRARRQLALVEREQAVTAERVRIAQDLHDALGAKVTEIVLLAELAAKSADIGATEHHPAREMLHELRELHTSLDEAVWSIDPENDSLVDLVEFVSEIAQRFLRHAPVSFHLEVSDNLPPAHLPARHRHNLLLAVKEALNNAVRHGHARTIWLQVGQMEGGVRIAVRDDGSGFEISTQPTGNGLRNMRDRLTAIGGKTEIRSQPGKGTEVVFELPLGGS